MQSPNKSPNRDPGNDFSAVNRVLYPTFLFVGVFSLFAYAFKARQHAIGEIWYFRCTLAMFIFSGCFLAIGCIINIRSISEYIAARKRYIGANIFLVAYIIFFIMAGSVLYHLYQYFGADVNTSYYDTRPFSTILVIKEFVAVNAIVIFFIIFLVDAMAYIMSNIEIKR